MSRENGIALPQALLLVLLVVGASSLLLQRSQVVHRDGLRERGHLEATQAAAAGISAARARLRRGVSCDAADFVVGRCRVTVHVTRDGKAQRIRAVAVAHPAGPHGPRVQVVRTADFRG